jgi:hypothetical protein
MIGAAVLGGRTWGRGHTRGREIVGDFSRAATGGCVHETFSRAKRGNTSADGGFALQPRYYAGSSSMQGHSMRLVRKENTKKSFVLSVSDP